LGFPVLKKRLFMICLPSVLSKVLKRSIALFMKDVNGNRAVAGSGFGRGFATM
jgi:hypothetical protein